MGQISLYNTIKIERERGIPVYLQIVNTLIKEIQSGRLRPGTKMMGVKSLATLLNVNKNTIEKVYTELELQQWIKRIPRKGTFVSEKLPDFKPKNWNNQRERTVEKSSKNYSENSTSVFATKSKKVVIFDGGLPDHRIIDNQAIARTHRNVLKADRYTTLFSYTNAYGDTMLRKELVKHLNDTRGIPCDEENILITRGSQMAIFLGMRILLKNNEIAIVSNPGYFGTTHVLEYIGANVLTVSVDEEGLVVDEIEDICKKNKVKVIYVTSHHHHPTTVSLSPSRRMSLLKLAEIYGFYILEDDYNYDFHYDNAPLLPLSSLDGLTNTIYTGSFSKTIGPGLRIGYLLADKKIIEKAVKIRGVIDVQGNPIMERAMGVLLQQGEIDRMLRRSRNIYMQRRDYLCEILNTLFSEEIDFKIPEGGLAVWAKFNESINLMEVYERTLAKNLNIILTPYYAPSHNATRLGFASLTFSEMEKYMGVLKSVLKTC